MHACWLLLAADRTIPARVLYSHPPQYAGDSGLISYVDLASPDFPEIIARDKQQEAPDALAPELDECCRALGIIAESSGFKKALAKAGKLAEYDAPILITGETGTGKEQVARLIHLMSGRLPNRFVPLNCSAIPGDLAESILFGHVKGAFTGAHADKKGEFEHAEGGTLFLDEIGELPENMQAKLLRVLQDGKIKPVGGNRERKCDLRMVAATNADLGQAIRRESFRLDLAQRFAATVDLPPLRDRPADIVPLATFALDCFNQEYGDNKRLTRDAIKALRETTWTGNVRELRSCVETSAMLAPSRLIRREDLQFSTHTSASAEIVTPEPHPGFAAKAYFAEVRHNLIRKAMKTARGNQSEAARLLGMTSQWIRKYLPPDFRN
jgi:transcriptional regulator with GAF, ATPase, and Fis domain